MKSKEIIFEGRKFVINYFDNTEELQLQIDNTGEALWVFCHSNEGEKLSDEYFTSIIKKLNPEIFFTSSELLKTDNYREMNLEVGYSVCSNYSNYVDNYLQLTFVANNINPPAKN